MNLNDYKVIELKNLGDYLNQGYIFLCDEYYHALIQTKIEVFEKKRINPIYYLGTTEEAYLISGHNSNENTDFMIKYFGRQNIDI